MFELPNLLDDVIDLIYYKQITGIFNILNTYKKKDIDLLTLQNNELTQQYQVKTNNKVKLELQNQCKKSIIEDKQKQLNNIQKDINKKKQLRSTLYEYAHQTAKQ